MTTAKEAIHALNAAIEIGEASVDHMIKWGVIVLRQRKAMRAAIALLNQGHIAEAKMKLIAALADEDRRVREMLR